MSPGRQFTKLLLLVGLVACSGSPPPGPPYRQEVSAPACLQEETYGETMRCDDNVKAKIQKEANWKRELNNENEETRVKE